jgi:hypothetical protein
MESWATPSWFRRYDQALWENELTAVQSRRIRHSLRPAERAGRETSGPRGGMAIREKEDGREEFGVGYMGEGDMAGGWVRM